MILKRTSWFTAAMVGIFALSSCGEPSETAIIETHVDALVAKPSTPTSIKLSNPLISPNRDNTPTLKITGVKSGQTVYVYKTSSCSSPIKSVKSKSSSVNITLSALSNGSYKFYTNTSNSAGKSKCKGYATYTVDRIAPAIPTIDSPSDSEIVDDSSVVLEGTCETGSTISISGNINSSPTTTTCVGSAFNKSITLTTLDGTKNLSIKATDKAGNQSGSVAHSLILDTEAPVISDINLSDPSTSPATDTTPEIEVTGTFTIGDSFQLFNDMTCTTPISSVVNAASTNSVIIASDVLTDDDYTFFVQGSDSIGNSTCESVQSVSYTLDTYAPTATITTPMTVINNANKTAYTFSGTCNDNSATISITAPSGVTGSTPCSSGTFSFAGKNISGQSDGSVNFTVRTEDSVGNFSTTTASATKDTITPAITISALSTITVANQTNYSINGTCSVNGDTITITTPAIAGSATCAGGTYTFTGKNVSGLADSTAASFTLRNTDAAGNYAAATNTALKDTTAPTDPSCDSFGNDATPTKSDTITWSGSSDATSGINHYEIMIYNNHDGMPVTEWMNIGDTVAPYQFTNISPKLTFKDRDNEPIPYVTYIRAVDNVGLATETSCSPWHLTPGYGNFTGTESTDETNPTHLNQSNPFALKYSDDHFNHLYFEHAENSETIMIKEPGNYLLSSTIPLQRLHGNDTGNAASAISTIKINGTATSIGVAANSFTRGLTGIENPINSSNHMMVMLENLQANDVITIETKNNADETEPLVVPLGSNFSTYMEYIPDEQEVFTATATGTIKGVTNLNSSGETKYVWTESIIDPSFIHSNDSEPEQIRFNESGDYLISVNVPFTGSSGDQKIEAHIYIDDIDTNLETYMVGSNGYVSNLNGHLTSSTNYTNVLYNVSAGSRLDVRTIQLGNAGEVTVANAAQASIYIQKINTNKKYYMSYGEDMLDWNMDFVASWLKDFIMDGDIFYHADTEIEVNERGDYLAYVSDRLTSSDNSNPIVRIKINGEPYPGAECSSHNMRGKQSSLKTANCDMQILLQDLRRGDRITFTSEPDIVGGVVTGNRPKITLRKVSE